MACRASPHTGFGGLTSRFDLWKPVIAAVNGFALGGGLEIALACDVIVAAEHARCGLPEPRVGLMAAAGGVHRLPRHIPLKIAMGMMLTGRPITRGRGAPLGLVNEVVPKPRLMEAAERWARRSPSARRCRCARARKQRCKACISPLSKRWRPTSRERPGSGRPRMHAKGPAHSPRNESRCGRVAEPRGLSVVEGGADT